MDNWQSIRDEFSLKPDVIYMNTGGLGLNPARVKIAQQNYAKVREEWGPTSAYTRQELENIIENCRGFVAQLLHCNRNEVVLTTNTTEGIRLVADSVAFRDGEEVITTDYEHDAGLYPWRYVIDRSQCMGISVRVRVLGLASRKKLPVEMFKSAVTEKTRIVFLSHVTYSTGEILPVQEIIKACREQAAEFDNERVVFVVDGAHALAQIAIDVHALDCDFYAVDSHKWLMGPEGAGALYVRGDFLHSGGERGVSFHTFRHGSLVGEAHPRGKSLDLFEWDSAEKPWDGERELELGTVSGTALAGFRSALRFFNTLGGIEEIGQRQRRLRRQMFQALDNHVPASEIVSPVLDSTATGTVAVRVGQGLEYSKLEELVRKLFQRPSGGKAVVCRAIPYPSCLRFCLSVINCEDEIVSAVEALRFHLDFR